MNFYGFCIRLYNLTDGNFDDNCYVVGRYGSITKKNRKGFIILDYIIFVILLTVSFLCIPVSLLFLLGCVIVVMGMNYFLSFGLVRYLVEYFHYKSNGEIQRLLNTFMENKEEYNHVVYDNKQYYIKRTNKINYLCYKGIVKETKKSGFLKIIIRNKKVILKKKDNVCVIKNLQYDGDLEIVLSKSISKMMGND